MSDSHLCTITLGDCKKYKIEFVRNIDAGYGYESERNENERDDSYASDGRVRGSKNNGTVTAANKLVQRA